MNAPVRTKGIERFFMFLVDRENFFLKIRYEGWPTGRVLNRRTHSTASLREMTSIRIQRSKFSLVKYFQAEMAGRRAAHGRAVSNWDPNLNSVASSPNRPMK